MRQLLAAAVGALFIFSTASDSPVVLQPQNPCAYVSAADVAPVVGGPVSAGRSTADMAPQMGESAVSCLFTPRATFAAMPGSNAGFEFAAVMFLDEATYRESITAHPLFRSAHRVSGFGDEAYEVGRPHYEMLFVSRGRYRVAFEVAAGFGSFFAPEEGLARVVVPRLPA